MRRAGVNPATASGPAANRSVYLHPGQMVVSAEPRMVTTILGSCVAVCLWDLSVRIGGMVHFLLPQAGDGTAQPSARCGDVAIPLLVRELRKHGGSERFMKAKVYGGACVLRAFRKENGDHLGARNVNVAKSALRIANIGITQEDVLGTLSRKVSFDTASGEVSIHFVQEAHGD